MHDIEAVLTQLSTHTTAQRRNTTASIPAQGSAVNSVLPHNTTRSKQKADELHQTAKRRRLYGSERRALKRALYYTFLETGKPAFETSQGTSCITHTDTFETPVGTSCPGDGPRNESTPDVVSVQVDIK